MAPEVLSRKDMSLPHAHAATRFLPIGTRGVRRSRKSLAAGTAQRLAPDVGSPRPQLTLPGTTQLSTSSQRDLRASSAGRGCPSPFQTDVDRQNRNMVKRRARQYVSGDRTTASAGAGPSIVSHAGAIFDRSIRGTEIAASGPRKRSRRHVGSRTFLFLRLASNANKMRHGADR